MNIDMTQGATMKSMLRFALPMILGNLLQQCYNIADTLIVGRFLGPNALAAVGSSFTLMTFLTSILLGLCLGSGAFFSMRFGEGDEKGLKEGICASFALIFSLTLIINFSVFKPNPDFSSGAKRSMGADAQLSCRDFLRHFCDIFIQLFCFLTARHRKLGCAAFISECLRAA